MISLYEAISKRKLLKIWRDLSSSKNEIPINYSALNILLENHRAYKEFGDRGVCHVIWKTNADRKDFALSVPNGQAFILVDNRDGFQDSRIYGCVPLADIIGKAKQIHMSIDPEGGIRWNRIGKILTTQ